MIYIKNKFLILTVSVLTGGLLLLGTTRVLAQTTTGVPNLVQMIADRFGLNKNDVQSVFDQYKTQRQARFQANFKTRLDQAVTAGTITPAQEQLILDKFQELNASRQANISSWKTMSPADRKAALVNQRQDLENWATQNGIPVNLLFGGFGMRGHRFMMGK